MPWYQVVANRMIYHQGKSYFPWSSPVELPAEVAKLHGDNLVEVQIIPDDDEEESELDVEKSFEEE